MVRRMAMFHGRVHAAAALLLSATTAAAAPMAVRYPEGPAHAFLVLSDPGGAAKAYGATSQAVRSGGEIESRLTFHFADGSLHDETVRFSQKRVFRLESYALEQRGAEFPEETALRFDRRSGRYHVRRRKGPAGEWETDGGAIALPGDLGNGLTTILLKNLPDSGRATVGYLAFTPTPRVLRMQLGRDGTEPFHVGPLRHTATRHRVRLELTGVVGALATVLGRQPEDVFAWLVRERDAPGVLRVQGPLYAAGPSWRFEVTPPRFGGD
jgi:hypothetical protein